MPSRQKVPLTERALCQRINRKLRSEGEAIKRARGNTSLTLGDYFVIDINRNFVVEHHVNLEDYGRELGVLQPFETLQAEAVR